VSCVHGFPPSLTITKFAAGSVCQNFGLDGPRGQVDRDSGTHLTLQSILPLIKSDLRS